MHLTNLTLLGLLVNSTVIGSTDPEYSIFDKNNKSKVRFGLQLVFGWIFKLNQFQYVNTKDESTMNADSG